MVQGSTVIKIEVTSERFTEQANAQVGGNGSRPLHGQDISTNNAVSV